MAKAINAGGVTYSRSALFPKTFAHAHEWHISAYAPGTPPKSFERCSSARRRNCRRLRSSAKPT